MAKLILLLLAIAAMFIFTVPAYSFASYAVTNLNTTVVLNQNTSAQVTEVLTLRVSNSSVNQYETDRLALNLTLSTWQSLVGPLLVQHIINPKSGIYDFKFLPGPLIPSYYADNAGMAKLMMTYYVNNATTVTETAPRTFVYSFNRNVFNFEHAMSGEVLPSNTTLNIIIPEGSKLKSIYPVPDAPISNFTSGYANTTTFSWFDGEPLSKFTFVFVIQQSLGAEVTSFFATLYNTLGIFSYIILGVVIAGFILYAYLRSGR